MEFKASMNNATKWMTVIVFLIVIASLIPLFFVDGIPYFAILLSAFILIPTLSIAYFLRPVGYVVDDSSLIIKKGMGSKKISLQDISEARTVTKNDLGFGIRLFGAGGFFGYFGEFKYKKTGRVTVQVTNPEKMILITLKQGKKYLISPDDTLEFMDAINTKALRLNTFSV